MNRFWIVVLLVCAIPCIGMAQDTLLFGDGDCYKYQEYEGDAYETHRMEITGFEFATDTALGKFPVLKNHHTLMQQYSDCDVIYGVAGLIDTVGLQSIFINWDGSGCSGFWINNDFVAAHFSDFFELYFVLGLKDLTGSFSIIDSVQWHPDSVDHYFQLKRTYNDDFTFVPIYNLYFDNPHTFDSKEDTIGVGIYVKKKDSIEYPNHRIGSHSWIHIFCVKNESDSVVWYSDPQYVESPSGGVMITGDFDSIPPKSYSGGFFPITCPKPEEPVEDTVDNGIRDVSYLNSNISIYPNPATDFITVNCDNLQKAVIYNSLGQQTLSFTTNKADISTLPNGIYTIRLDTPKGTIVKKIVKR